MEVLICGLEILEKSEDFIGKISGHPVRTKFFHFLICNLLDLNTEYCTIFENQNLLISICFFVKTNKISESFV